MLGALLRLKELPRLMELLRLIELLRSMDLLLGEIVRPTDLELRSICGRSIWRVLLMRL